MPESRDSPKVFRAEIMLRTGIAVHGRETQFVNECNKEGVNLIEEIRRSKLKLEIIENKILVSKTAYVDALDMIDDLQSMTLASSGLVDHTSVTLTDELAQYLDFQSRKMKISSNMCILMILQTTVALEACLKLPAVSDSEILRKISHSKVVFGTEEGTPFIKVVDAIIEKKKIKINFKRPMAEVSKQEAIGQIKTPIHTESAEGIFY